MPPVWEMSLCAIFYCLQATDATLAFPCAFPSPVIWCETFLLASSHGLITPSADYSVTYCHFLSPSQSSPYLGHSSQLSTTSQIITTSVISHRLSFLRNYRSPFQVLVENEHRTNHRSVCNPYTAPHLWCYLLLAQKSNTILQA